jgi:hypothetical protein
MLWPKTQICFAADGGGAPAPAPAPTTPWYTGAEAEIIGDIQNRGLADKDPKEVALHFAKAHREAQKIIGVPQDKLLRIPDAADAPAVKAFWERLGAPKEAKDYEFKNADGTALDAKLDGPLRAVAAKLNLPKEAAAEIAGEVAKLVANDKTTSEAERAAALVEEKTKLAANWGANQETNMVIAKNAAAALGVKPEEVAALEKVVGYSRVMELFRSIGTKIGEAKFITSPSGNGGVMTREQAVTTKAELLADKNWSKRYMEGGREENRQLQDLLKIITAS